MARISVIVPVYKVEIYLHRCVESIFHQTFQDFELILVDDGSPDNCGALCDAYARPDSRVHVIHQENGGLSAARNAGIDWVLANSETEYLAFVDSDDWVAPEYLELLYRAVTECGCLISACGLCRTTGEELPPVKQGTIRKLTAADYYCSETIHGGVTAVAWNKLYHRALFKSLRYPVGKLHEDEFTTYQLVYQAGQVGVVLEPLYAYYQNPQGIMLSSWNPRRMHLLEAVGEQIAFARENDHPELLKKAAEQYLYCAHEQLRMAAASPETRTYLPALRRHLRKALALERKERFFSRERDIHWAYEEAYPCRILWFLVGSRRKMAEKRGKK